MIDEGRTIRISARNETRIQIERITTRSNTTNNKLKTYRATFDAFRGALPVGTRFSRVSGERLLGGTGDPGVLLTLLNDAAEGRTWILSEMRRLSDDDVDDGDRIGSRYMKPKASNTHHTLENVFE